MKIQSLHYYPIKSCGAVNVTTLPLKLEGPLNDREWMLVDPSGKFVTQREIPRLSLVIPDMQAEGMLLTGPGGKIFLPYFEPKGLTTVEVWGDKVEAMDEGRAVREWMTETFGQDLRLVRMKGQRTRDRVSVRFADSYPLHLCSVESLAELNSRLPKPVEMARFRPNIVIEGAPAFAEDEWNSLKMGSWDFARGKACARCSITRVDQATGVRGEEPLKTLATYRRKNNKVEFGQYFHSVNGAELSVGMECFPS